MALAAAYLLQAGSLSWATYYLLNPLPPDARECEIERCRWISYGRRLFGIREK